MFSCFIFFLYSILMYVSSFECDRVNSCLLIRCCCCCCWPLVNIYTLTVLMWLCVVELFLSLLPFLHTVLIKRFIWLFLLLLLYWIVGVGNVVKRNYYLIEEEENGATTTNIEGREISIATQYELMLKYLLELENSIEI